MSVNLLMTPLWTWKQVRDRESRVNEIHGRWGLGLRVSRKDSWAVCFRVSRKDSWAVGFRASGFQERFIGGRVQAFGRLRDS